MRPGFDVVLRDAPVPRGAPTDVSTGFIVGPTEKGQLDATLRTAPDDYTDSHGGSVAYSTVPDVVEAGFEEGLGRVYIKRVVGPAAEVATIEFDDNAAAPTLAVDAEAPGEWYNGLNVEIVVTGGTFRIEVTHDDDPEKLLLVSPEFDNKPDAVAWSQVVDGAGLGRIIRVRSLAPATLPVAATSALAGGDSDIDGITNAETIAALDSISRWLGPGQVAVPGNTSAAIRTAVLAHCAATNRRAVLDAPNDPNAAVLIAAANQHKADPNARFGALFGPWDVIPGRFPDTQRIVPPCGRVLGTIARSDKAGDNPNLAAAGDNGVSLFALSLTQTYTDDEYTDLNEAGVNMSRTLWPGSPVQLYGFRTLVDPNVDERWVEFSGSRTVMYVTSQANARMAAFAFDQIDGQGHKFSELGGSITGILLPLYNPPKLALFGDSPQEAFRVEVGPTVNTPERVRNRELRAVIAMRTSPFAEHVVTEIVRRMVTEEV